MRIIKVSLTLGSGHYSLRGGGYDVEEKPKSYRGNRWLVMKSKLMTPQTMLRNTAPGVIGYYAWCLPTQYHETIDLLHKRVQKRLKEVTDSATAMTVAFNQGFTVKV